VLGEHAVVVVAGGHIDSAAAGHVDVAAAAIFAVAGIAEIVAVRRILRRVTGEEGER